MFSSGLPNVGATATLLGVAAFTQQAAQVTRGLAGINAATANLGRVSVASWAAAGTAAGSGSASFLRASGVIGTALAGVAVAVKALNATANFQQITKNIEILSEASSQQLGALNDSTFKLAKQFGALPTEIATVNAELARGGASFSQMENGATKATLAIVRATNGEIGFADAAKIAIQGANLYGATFDRVANSIVGAANKSTASVTDIRIAFRQAIIPPAVGAEIEEVSAAISILGSNGFEGERGGTALRNMFLRLLDPTKEALAVMKKYNISVFDATGKSLGFTNVIERVVDAFKLTGDAAIDAQKAFDASDLFGARQGSAATIFAKTGIEPLRALTSELRNNVDAVRQSERQMDTWQAQLKRVSATLVTMVTQALLPVTAALTPMTRQFADLLGAIDAAGAGAAINALAASFGRTVAQLAPVAVGIFSVVDSLNMFYRVAGGSTVITNGFNTALKTTANIVSSSLAVLSLFVQTMTGIPQVMNLVNLALQALPFLVVAAGVLSALGAVRVLAIFFIGPLLAAIAAVISVVGTLITAFALIIPAISAAIGIMLAMGGVLGTLLFAIVPIVPELLLIGAIAAITAKLVYDNFGVISATAISMSQAVIKAVSAVGQNIVAIAGFIGQVASLIGEALVLIAGSIGRFVIGIGEAIVAQANWASQTNTLDESIISSVGSMVNSVVGFLANLAEAWGLTWQSVSNIIGQFVDFILPTSLKAAINMLTAFLNGVGQFANNWDTLWTDIANSVARALNISALNFTGFLELLLQGARQMPILKEILKIGDAIGSAASFTAKFATGVKSAVNGITANFEALSANVKLNLDTASASIRKFIADADAAVAAQRQAAALREWAMGGGPKPDFSPERADPGTSTFPTAGGAGGGGGKEPTIRDLTKDIQAALSDIPGAGKELASFLANIAKDAPQRLAPMIAAIRSVKTQIAQTTLAARDLARTNSAIAASNKRLAVLQAQAGRIEIQQALAVLGYDRQILSLRFQTQAIDVQMFPLRDAIEKIDRQISDLARENLGLVREQLKLQQQMLPLRSAIEDIEHEINKLQRPNLEAAKAIAKIELQMLPLQQRRADIDAEIAELQRVNYNLVQQRLSVEIRALPIRQAAERLELAMQRIHTNNLGLVQKRLQQEYELLKPRREIAALEREITGLVSRQVDLTRSRDELIAQQGVAVLEDQLSAIETAMASSDGGGDAGLQEAHAGVTAQLEIEKKALEQLERAHQRQGRAEEITRLGLEIRKAAIEDQIQPMVDQVAIITEQETAFTALAEIQRTVYEIQQQALKDILLSYDAQLLAIQQTGDAETLRRDLEVSFLQERQQLIDIILASLEREAKIIQDAIALETKRREITIIGLEQERLKLIELLEPLEKKFDITQRLMDEEKLRNQIQITFLEEERRKLIEQLRPLEDKRKAIEREIAMIELQREAVRIQFEEQKAGIQELILQEQLKRADLEVTRIAQQEIFEELALAVFKAILDSKEFSVEEATEVSKRINLWNDEIDAVQKRVTELQALEEAAAIAAGIAFGNMVTTTSTATEAATNAVEGFAAETKAAIDAIPKEINIIVRYTTIGSPGGGNGTKTDTGKGGDAGKGGAGDDGRSGGNDDPGTVDPGPDTSDGDGDNDGGAGDRNEAFTSTALLSATTSASRSAAGANTIIENNISYNVAASYANTQSPATVRHDLQALLALSRG